MTHSLEEIEAFIGELSIHPEKSNLYLMNLLEDPYLPLKAVQLLNSPSTRTPFFAAFFLSNSIPKTWFSFPDNDRSRIRTFLLQYLSQIAYQNQNQALLNETAKAISKIMILEFPKYWNDPIQDLIERSINSQEHCLSSLLILSTFFEEVQTQQNIIFYQTIQQSIQNELSQKMDIILQFLFSLFEQQSNVEIMKMSLKVFSGLSKFIHFSKFFQVQGVVSYLVGLMNRQELFSFSFQIICQIFKQFPYFVENSPIENLFSSLIPQFLLISGSNHLSVIQLLVSFLRPKPTERIDQVLPYANFVFSISDTNNPELFSYVCKFWTLFLKGFDKSKHDDSFIINVTPTLIAKMRSPIIETTKFKIDHEHPYYDKLESFIFYAMKFNSEFISSIISGFFNKLLENFSIDYFQVICFSLRPVSFLSSHHSFPFYDDLNQSNIFFNYLLQQEHDEIEFILSSIFVISWSFNHFLIESFHDHFRISFCVLFKYFNHQNQSIQIRAIEAFCFSGSEMSRFIFTKIIRKFNSYSVFIQSTSIFLSSSINVSYLSIFCFNYC